MNTQALETRFEEENDPFRFVIVCAMWITGFDVPTLSTLYIDKPLKSHTLMQAISRANRISEGKNNGLIVDYIETCTALLDALVIYGNGGEDNNGGGKGGGKVEPPVKSKTELIHQLEETLVATETFLLDEVNFELQELIKANGLEKLAAMEKGINPDFVLEVKRTDEKCVSLFERANLGIPIGYRNRNCNCCKALK